MQREPRTKVMEKTSIINDHSPKEALIAVAIYVSLVLLAIVAFREIVMGA
jgi:hypothetical protein